MPICAYAKRRSSACAIRLALGVCGYANDMPMPTCLHVHVHVLCAMARMRKEPWIPLLAEVSLRTAEDLRTGCESTTIRT
eukprot:6197139-Pleurochrysis_carterae.AAC.2